MFQRRQIGLAQHQANVGVGHQLATGVDHVGLALVADPDARDYVPDELEVDLGDRDPAGRAARAQAHREIGLGLLAKVHRPDPRLARLGIEKRGVGRAVLAGAGGIHRQPRHSQHFLAARIELDDVGHRGRLAQQLEKFDAALLGAFAA